jgi:3-phenylpropionate/trans-cinnamate dioxygenase ferredoxin subunit
VSLADGDVHCETRELECIRHGSAFSLETGRPNTLPATQPVPVYVAEVRDGAVWVSTEPRS